MKTPINTKTANHPLGTIVAEHDEEYGWTLFVAGCRCVRFDGTPQRRHVKLREAEECSARVLGGMPYRPIRLAPAGAAV